MFSRSYWPLNTLLPLSYDTIAPVYDWLAGLVFGSSLRRAQDWCAEQAAPGSRVLVLGGGTGSLLLPLLATKPGSVLYLEASAQMLARAQRRVVNSTDSQRIVFCHGTERDLAEGDTFDLLILPFVLDMYTETTLTTALLPRLQLALGPAGALAVADFDQPHTRWQRLQLWAMIRFFRVVAGIETSRLPQWPQVLQQAGFVEVDRATLRRGQVRMGRWQRVTPSPTPGILPLMR